MVHHHRATHQHRSRPIPAVISGAWTLASCLVMLQQSCLLVVLLLLLGCASSSSRAEAGQTTSAVRTEQPQRLLSPRIETPPMTFSKEWMHDMLSSGEEGRCGSVGWAYEWRDAGWGSNINSKSRGNNLSAMLGPFYMHAQILLGTDIGYDTCT